MSNTERNIDKLLEKYKNRIKELKFLLKDKLTQKHDDIFLLKYCLSTSNNKDAEKSIRKAFKFRKHNQWLELAETKGEESTPYREIIDKYVSSKVHLCKIDGGPVVIIQAGAGDPKKLMDELSEDRFANSLTYQKECCMLMCDKLTRETRILTKMIAINDLRGASLKNTDKRFFNAVGKSSKISEKLFPQLVEKNIIVNPPPSMKVLLSMARLFMSKRSMEKLVFCKGDTLKGKWEDCPFAKKYFLKNLTPTFLGGDYKIENSLVVNTNVDNGDINLDLEGGVDVVEEEDPIMLEGDFDELILVDDNPTSDSSTSNDNN